jgi:hypothetical protein
MARDNTSGAAVLLVHHEGRAGGREGRASRGASSLFGLVGQQLQLTRRKGHPTQRRLTTLGRYDETPPALLLDYVPNGLPPYKSAGVWIKPKHYVQLGTPQEVNHATKDADVLAALKSGRATAKQLAKRTGIARTQLDPVLSALVTKRTVSRAGSGKKGSLRVFAREEGGWPWAIRP